ncbi:MAG: acetate kinase [Betaproteobacteria bacterium HGW-Betaproteobacteria-11]|nr:MAG: acetate kinase [Betaproteobacteria bacterium HGW-Betaproteobacteria-11]
MTHGALLTLNAGSSSIKFALFADAAAPAAQAELCGQIEGLDEAPGGTATAARLSVHDAAGRPLADQELPHTPSHASALQRLLDWLDAHLEGRSIRAVGHRVVHGGTQFAAPAVVSAPTFSALRELIPLAPLHQPHNLAGIEAMLAFLPGVPQVACFDTAFHRTQPELAQRFALPRALLDAGVRRYGFHGLSYEYIAEVLPQHLPAEVARGRVLVAHLGNGASMCALQDRRSIASTMGFTALDGLVMGTRCGTIDPGVLLYLLEQRGMSATAISHLLYHQSGLLGVSGISADMHTLLASSEPLAAEAVELFCYRAAREAGSLIAALGGLDALIFTGGIGEHAAPVREKICARLGWLGLELDSAAHAATAVPTPARVISTTASRIAVAVIPTNEEWMIARHTAHLIEHTTIG